MQKGWAGLHGPAPANPATAAGWIAQARSARPPAMLLADRFFQAGVRLELDDLLRGDLDHGASAGIASLACRALADFEGPERGHGDLLVLLERLGNMGKQVKHE